MYDVKVVYHKDDGGSVVELHPATSVEDDGACVFVDKDTASEQRFCYTDPAESINRIFITNPSGATVHRAEGVT